MRNNPIISFLLGLILLAAITDLVFENVIRTSISDDSIELSEFMDDSEEEHDDSEEDTEEEEVIPFDYINSLSIALSSEESVSNKPYLVGHSYLYIKIPVPPPELV